MTKRRYNTCLSDVGTSVAKIENAGYVNSDQKLRSAINAGRIWCIKVPYSIARAIQKHVLHIFDWNIFKFLMQMKEKTADQEKIKWRTDTDRKIRRSVDAWIPWKRRFYISGYFNRYIQLNGFGISRFWFLFGASKFLF